jgi:hypothetical protein
MCKNDLATRIVFIDTSAYQSKNFQFGQHALGKLEQLVNDEKVYLLTTDVTNSEIESHLKEHAEHAAKAVKIIQKDAMFLRNTDELPCYGLFEKVTSDEIFQIVNQKFKTLIESPNVEIVPIDNINPKIVFERYFNKTPPFDKANKKNEFPDAFVLEAVNKLSQERHQSVYVVSGDGDMQSFTKEHENLLYLNRVDEFIDLVLRNSEELEEPAKYADSILEQLKGDLLIQAKEYLLASEVYSDDIEGLDDEIVEIIVNDIKISNKNLLEVSGEEAEYEIDFDVEINAEFSISAYDRSPWDPEDKVYMFVLYNQLIKKYIETYSANVVIGFTDGLKINAEIIELSFEGSFELNSDNGEVIHYKEFDINGD